MGGEAPARRSLSPQLYYTLDRPPSKWAYGTGFINAEMVRVIGSEAWTCTDRAFNASDRGQPSPSGGGHSGASLLPLARALSAVVCNS